VKRRAKRNSVLLWVFLFLFLLAGCGGGSPPVPGPKKEAAAPAKKKAEPVKAEEKKDEPKEAEYAYNPVGKQDPFRPFLQLTPLPSKSVPLTPLQKYEISQLRLVAILSAPDGNVGLVEDATGKGYFLKKGTLVGKNDGKVSKVLKDRVVVEEVFLDALSQKKVNEITMTLHKPEEGGEQ